MTRLSVRLSLLVLCLAALGGAAFLLWSSDRAARLTADASRQFDLGAEAARVSIADLRAAQQAYVAVGQGEDFWFARVAAIRTELDSRIAGLRGIASTPESAVALDDAAAALQDFAQMDARARDYTRGRQLTLASDMVFADGLELTKRAGDAIDRAATSEQVAADATLARARRREALIVAGATAVALLGLLTLVPVPRRANQVVVMPGSAPPAPAMSDGMLDDLNDFGLVARPVTRTIESARTVNIGGIAELCGDLARIGDTRALPALLERTASVLDASGIVVWIADPDGRELAPILVHGYPPHLATRLGTILRDAENVTASAYRTALLQTMKGDAISSGAIAVPLVASSGCVGVMAAEVKNGGEQQEDLLATATIIAAQLATLVGPPTRAKAEAAG
jgi:hypothetical protein